jgi:hypothetical protein
VVRRRVHTHDLGDIRFVPVTEQSQWLIAEPMTANRRDYIAWR